MRERERERVYFPSMQYKMKSVAEQGLFHELAFNNKALKTFVKF